MASITLKDRVHGTITFSDAPVEWLNRIGTLQYFGGTRQFSISFSTPGVYDANNYDVIAPTNLTWMCNAIMPSAQVSTGYYMANCPTALDLPLSDVAFDSTFSTLRLLADIPLVEPGRDTQAEPGYSLRVYGAKFDKASSGEYMCYDAYVGFQLWATATNTRIADLNIGRYSGNTTFLAFYGDTARFQYYPSFPDCNPRLYLGYDGTHLYFLLIGGSASGTGNFDNSSYSCDPTNAIYINDDIIKNYWHLTTSDTPIEDMEVNLEYGTYSKPGGYTGQSFDDSSDTVPLPSVPTYGVTNSGFIHLYKVLQTDLESLGGELFPTFADGGDIVSAVNTLVKVITQQNLINYIQDCRVLPVNATTTSTEGIKLAGKTLTTVGSPVTQDYVDFDCGELEVGERYVNFADYEPFTMAKLYLPFVGFVPIAMEYVSGGSLHIIYRFNLMDGSFVAYVKATSSKSALTDSVIAQYGGNCCVHMPITGLNYATMVTGIVGGAMQMVSGVGSMSAGLGQVSQGMDAPNHSRMLSGSGLTLTGYGIGSMASGFGSYVGGLADILSAKPDYQQSNNYNATTSFLTVRKPYLLIGRPVPQFSAKYPEENGLPLNVTKKLSDCSGFTKVGMCILEGIECTDSEKDMIQSYLNSGVII